MGEVGGLCQNGKPVVEFLRDIDVLGRGDFRNPSDFRDVELSIIRISERAVNEIGESISRPTNWETLRALPTIYKLSRE